MTSEELAAEVTGLAEIAASRVLGVGDKQYSVGDKQKFEGYTIDRLFGEAEDELADIVSYAAMLRVRLRRLREAVNQADLKSVPGEAGWNALVELLPYVGHVAAAEGV